MLFVCLLTGELTMNQSDLEMLTSKTAIKYYLVDTFQATIANTITALADDIYSTPDNLEAVAWLDERTEQWEDYIIKMLELVGSNFVTVQSLIGLTFNSVDAEPKVKLAVGEFLVNALLTNEGIDVSYSREIRITSKLDNHLPSELGYILPNISPVRAKGNKTKYGTFSESVLTGGSLKQHNGELCLDHLNRMNKVEFVLTPELAQLVDMTFEAEPKYKDSGLIEDASDIAKREKQFRTLKQELAGKCAQLLQYCTRFSYGHKYCTRGRTYLKAYHFNYQSLKFIRGLIQFADGEVIKPDFGE